MDIDSGGRPAAGCILAVRATSAIIAACAVTAAIDCGSSFLLVATVPAIDAMLSILAVLDIQLGIRNGQWTRIEYDYTREPLDDMP